MATSAAQHGAPHELPKLFDTLESEFQVRYQELRAFASRHELYDKSLPQEVPYQDFKRFFEEFFEPVRSACKLLSEAAAQVEDAGRYRDDEFWDTVSGRGVRLTEKYLMILQHSDNAIRVCEGIIDWTGEDLDRDVHALTWLFNKQYALEADSKSEASGEIQGILANIAASLRKMFDKLQDITLHGGLEYYRQKHAMEGVQHEHPQVKKRGLASALMADASASSDGQRPTKRQNTGRGVEGYPAGWYGDQGERLMVSEQFDAVMRQANDYLKNLGSDSYARGGHAAALEDFVRRAARAAGIYTENFEANVFEPNWSHRNEGRNQGMTLSFLEPACLDPNSGGNPGKSMGMNDYKMKLGGRVSFIEAVSSQYETDFKYDGQLGGTIVGGLTRPRLRRGALQSPEMTEKRARRTLGRFIQESGSRESSSANLGLSSSGLRGGALEVPETPEQRRRREAKIRTDVAFGDPAKLWKQLEKDRDIPVLQNQDVVMEWRSKAYYAPVMNPSSDLTTPRRYLRQELGKTFDEHKGKWLRLRNEENESRLMSAQAEISIRRTQNEQKIKDFLKRHVKAKGPALDQVTSHTEIGERYDSSLTHREFTEPMGAVFESRLLDILSLHIANQQYKLGRTTLDDLLRTELERYQGWDLHESVWQEFDEYRVLHRNSQGPGRETIIERWRYRETCRKAWEAEMNKIRACRNTLKMRPNHYESDIVMETLDEATARLAKEQEEMNQNVDEERRKGQRKLVEDLRKELADCKKHGQKQDTTKNLEYLRRLRDAYSDEREKSIKQNDQLDLYDPGNAPLIQQNSVDIMAKNQLIWGLDAQIRHLATSLDPFEKQNAKIGVDLKYALPPDDVINRDITAPLKIGLPTGITSRAPGPMPGEHPTPNNSRVLIGAHAGFARAVNVSGAMHTQDQSPAEPTGSDRQSDEAVPDPLPAPINKPLSDIKWDDFLHWATNTYTKKNSMSNGTSTVTLNRAQWIDTVTLALRTTLMEVNSEEPAADAVKNSAFETARRHVNSHYIKYFKTVANEKAKGIWDIERGRWVVLLELSQRDDFKGVQEPGNLDTWDPRTQSFAGNVSTPAWNRNTRTTTWNNASGMNTGNNTSMANNNLMANSETNMGADNSVLNSMARTAGVTDELLNLMKGTMYIPRGNAGGDANDDDDHHDNNNNNNDTNSNTSTRGNTGAPPPRPPPSDLTRPRTGPSTWSLDDLLHRFDNWKARTCPDETDDEVHRLFTIEVARLCKHMSRVAGVAIRPDFESTAVAHWAALQSYWRRSGRPQPDRPTQRRRFMRQMVEGLRKNWGDSIAFAIPDSPHQPRGPGGRAGSTPQPSVGGILGAQGTPVAQGTPSSRQRNSQQQPQQIQQPLLQPQNNTGVPTGTGTGAGAGMTTGMGAGAGAGQWQSQTGSQLGITGSSWTAGGQAANTNSAVPPPSASYSLPSFNPSLNQGRAPSTGASTTGGPGGQGAGDSRAGSKRPGGVGAVSTRPGGSGAGSSRAGASGAGASGAGGPGAGDDPSNWGIPGSDGWPQLRDLIQASKIARFAEAMLSQPAGRHYADSPAFRGNRDSKQPGYNGRLGFPYPRYVQRDIVTGIHYVEL
ncbi:hypothetical protein F5Y15DRAFT_428307 [Xylariaceae sp. FL0016]|nr:hypothetical protein F5Y15DRAFT_428307 [Xylariaceae sp. FL0016]